jgi:hypothetical protein
LTAAQKAVCVQQLTLLLNAVPRNAVQFRKLRKQIIDALTKNGLTIGEAQKLVNLASKYLYAYYYAEIDRPWMANHHWINSIAGEMHVPIDSIVLESLHGKYPKMMLCLPTGIGADRIQCPHAGNVWTWSQLDCAVCYRQIQVFCRKQAHREGYIDAVEFEMAQLWR